MPSPQYEELRRIGFSDAFLKSPAGSHPALRTAIQRHPKAWRTCSVCLHKYCDVSAINTSIADAKGGDLRRTATGPHKAGFCSRCCADEKFGGGDKTLTAIKGYFLAIRPDFYEQRQWRELRYQVLEERGARCDCCGRTSKDGVVIHVDHIKPRKRFPHLALDKSNLQVLCADCNLGKGADFDTDWRGAA